jgi:hypothetical protein
MKLERELLHCRVPTNFCHEPCNLPWGLGDESNGGKCLARRWCRLCNPDDIRVLLPKRPCLGARRCREGQSLKSGGAGHGETEASKTRSKRSLKEGLHNEGGSEPADEQQGQVGPQQQDSSQSDEMGMLTT